MAARPSNPYAQSLFRTAETVWFGFSLMSIGSRRLPLTKISSRKAAASQKKRAAKVVEASNQG